MEVIITGAGIGGLTLGLRLHKLGIPCRIYEAAPELKALGVGINLLPHATKELAELGLLPALERVGITTTDISYYNRFGQFIYKDPSGRFAGYEFPQFSIHRGDLQMVLLDAFRERAGADRVVTGHKCIRVDQDANRATAYFEHPFTKESLPPQSGDVIICCEGIHSMIRKQFYPNEGPPRYSGINMWRGVTRWKPYLTGASMVRIGWLNVAKVLIYPIRNNIDAEGRQLINWVLDIETPTYKPERDWNRPGRLEDFIDRVADWHFDWLDVPDMMRHADAILEFPMIDQDPLATLELRPRHSARRRRASDVAPRRQWRCAGDPRLPRVNGMFERLLRSGGGPQSLRRSPSAADRQRRSDESHQPARRHPPGGVFAHRRQAVSPHRRRHQPR